MCASKRFAINAFLVASPGEGRARARNRRSRTENAPDPAQPLLQMVVEADTPYVRFDPNLAL
jgi:hypothetical protein